MKRNLLAAVIVGLAGAVPAYATDAQVNCLASTMWGEARGEGDVGMLAVADVVLNRVNRSGATICATVRARAQFIGYGKNAPSIIIKLAESSLNGLGRGSTYGATHFTRFSEHPKWARHFRVTTRIGNHVFYKGGVKP